MKINKILTLLMISYKTIKGQPFAVKCNEYPEHFHDNIEILCLKTNEENWWYYHIYVKYMMPVWT